MMFSREVALADETRVISYSLFLGGESPAPPQSPAAARPDSLDRYIMALAARRDEAARFFARWRLRIYLDAAFAPAFARWLERAGYEVVRLPPYAPHTRDVARMMMRLLVADDAAVDRFLIRDLDSPLSVRDLLAVTAWIEAGDTVLIERDHAYHGVPMMGGMWGARSARLRSRQSGRVSSRETMSPRQED